MSRAITITIGELTAMKIMAEQGLGDIACQDIRESTDIPMAMEIKGNPEGVLMRETQFDFVPEMNSRSEGFPQIRFSRKGVMTFIEIIIPNLSRSGDVQGQPIGERILEKGNPEPAEDPDFLKNDFVEFGNVSFEIPELMEFSFTPGLSDAIKALESGEQDFSLTALDNAFGIPKSLPAHNDMMDLNDILYGLRKKKKEKEFVKTKSE